MALAHHTAEPEGRIAGLREAAHDSDRSCGRERAEVVPVALVDKGAFAGLVHAGELEVDPAPFEKIEFAEADGEPALVPVLDCLGGADRARAARI